MSSNLILLDHLNIQLGGNMDLGLYGSQDLSNTQYHAVRGFYSSSQLKTAMEDVELFHKQYILGEVVAQKHIPAFDIGTYYHTAILEPENLEKECIVYEGDPSSKAKTIIRRGKHWDEFKQEHKEKAIITKKELFLAENLIQATKDSPIATEYLSKGIAELSCFTTLMGVPTKVRADWINIQGMGDSKGGYILDLKSTTGNCKDENAIKKKISNYNYDLSASLYIDAFNAHYGEDIIKDFYWTFASKDFCNSRTYKASKEMLEVGRRKYKYALNQIIKYQEQDWQFYDELAEIGPASWESDEWIKGDKGKATFSTFKPEVRQATDGDLL